MLNKIRIFYNCIRGYEFGDPKRNGEYRFLRKFVKKGMVVVDVGANVGDYSHYIFAFTGGNIELHCFEPVRATFRHLEKRFNRLHQRQKINLNNSGLSDKEGQAKIKIYGATDGVNSLYERRSAINTHPGLANFREEPIRLTTLDAYVSDCKLGHIDLLKIDVEGHELKVLEGAVNVIEKGKVTVIQFEYGGCFLDSGAKLEKIYGLLSQNGYKLFRLLPYGKIKVRNFHSYLENYKFSNWIAIKT